jgi:hypothetical protein
MFSPPLIIISIGAAGNLKMSAVQQGIQVCGTSGVLRFVTVMNGDALLCL